MKCNVGKTDRIIRIVVGAGVLAAHYINYAVTGNYIVWANLAFIPLVTGIIGYCPPYSIFKINTKKKKEASEA